MNQKTIAAIVGVLVVALAALSAYTAPRGGRAVQKPAATTSTPVVVPPEKLNTYTLAQVAEHASASSCWTVVNGSVYDVTTWIAQHPGGSAAIVKLCGKDGSALFNAQHGGQPNPEKALASFKIGTLIK